MHNNNNTNDTPFGLLIGPEGGWTDEELELTKKYKNLVQFVSLNSNILRSETAAIAAISQFSAAVDYIKEIENRK